jgi:hypothetical protein
LEGESESHEKYKAWSVGPPPVKFKATEYKARVEDRDFASTTTSDYVPHPKSAIHVPVRFKKYVYDSPHSLLGQACPTICAQFEQV